MRVLALVSDVYQLGYLTTQRGRCASCERGIPYYQEVGYLLQEFCGVCSFSDEDFNVRSLNGEYVSSFDSCRYCSLRWATRWLLARSNLFIRLVSSSVPVTGEPTVFHFADRARGVQANPPFEYRIHNVNMRKR